MFVYLIVNHETSKYYVGQHKGSNLKKYLQQKLHHARRGISENSRLFHSMRKHPDPKVWSIHALRSDIQDRIELDQIERDFIRFLRSQDPEYGYNIQRGGEGFTGPHTKATCSKISAASKEMWSSYSPQDRRVHSLKIRKAKQLNKKPQIEKLCPVCGGTFFVSFGKKKRVYCSSTCFLHRIKDKRSEQIRLNALRKAQKSPTFHIHMSEAQSVRRRREREQGIKPVMPMRHVWTDVERLRQAERMRLRQQGRPMPKSQRDAISNALKGMVCDDKRKASLDRGRHTRWHVARGILSNGCGFCLRALSPLNR